VWGQKAPSKHENGGKKRPQNHKVGAESAHAQIRAEKRSYRTKCVDENRFQALKIKG